MKAKKMKLIEIFENPKTVVIFGQQKMTLKRVNLLFKQLVEEILNESNLSREHFYGKVSGRVLNWTLETFLQRCAKDGLF